MQNCKAIESALGGYVSGTELTSRALAKRQAEDMVAAEPQISTRTGPQKKAPHKPPKKDMKALLKGVVIKKKPKSSAASSSSAAAGKVRSAMDLPQAEKKRRTE